MIEQLITDHLDLWSSAVRPKSSAGRGSNSKLELTGIKKLRELILELAVRGKLVPQDPSDEPASVLLERIAAEKAKLVKEGKIKKSKPLPEITEEEIPFELPEGWGITRIGDVINVLNGRAYKKHEMLDSGTPLLRVGNLFTSDKWYYSDLELEPEKYIDDGDLIYSWSASFGPFIWKGGRVIYHYHIWKMDVFDGNSLDKYFMRLYLDAISASIKASGNGIAMIHMTKERMESLVVPVPPIAEQHRIVAKVDKLMSLCDQLEQKSEASLAAHQTLVETLLATLIESADAAELTQNWARLALHFDSLFTTQSSIDALKQTILQLAVMGKLVPQDPDDEPASVLLERIKAEKARLVKEGKIKKEKPLPPISEEEKPFALPDGWEWVRLNSISELITKGSSPKWQGISYTNNEDDVLFVTSENVHAFSLSLTEKKFVERRFNEIESRSILKKNDLLMNIVGGSIGRVSIFELDCCANINQAVCLIRVIEDSIGLPFLLLFLNSPTCLFYMFDKQVDNARANLSMGNISQFLIPVPPLYEQQRIAIKFRELISLCDQLSARLQASQTTQLNLAEALVEGALN